MQGFDEDFILECIRYNRVEKLASFLKKNNFDEDELLPFIMEALILCKTHVFEVFLEEGRVQPSDYLLKAAVQNRCAGIVAILINDPRVDPWYGLRFSHDSKIIDILNSHISKYSSPEKRNYNLPLDRIISQIETDIDIINRRLPHDRYQYNLLNMRDKLEAKKMEVISVQL